MPPPRNRREDTKRNLKEKKLPDNAHPLYRVEFVFKFTQLMSECTGTIGCTLASPWLYKPGSTVVGSVAMIEVCGGEDGKMGSVLLALAVRR